MSWRLGIDIGGAFTDLLAVDDKTGGILSIKVESTPDDYSRGVLDALAKSEVDLKHARYVVHGQTVAINTVVTRSGSKVGLLVTRGFDIYEIGRANRRDLFNLRYRKPQPFVPLRLTMGVRERIMADGTVLTPLNEDDVKVGVHRLLSEGVQSFAVCFINSYSNALHEKNAGDILVRELTQEGVTPFITLSHELTREWREYERASTAVMNAYCQPTLSAYISRLKDAFEEHQFEGTFYIMLASAGMATSDYAKRYPVTTIEGGPVAGIVGGIALAEIIGDRDIIVLDGGSTTTKAGLVRGLEPVITTEYYVERDRFAPGHPIRVPVVEIVEVGNGGTSIAWIDEVGSLKVGPRAAGAYPGPMCYGRGGKEPTITDAYVANGYLNPEYLLGGELQIDRQLASESFQGIASHYDTPVEEAADAAIRIAVDQASHIIKLISVQRGFDPRDFTLVAHGGSGPMFAPFIARELQIPKIVVPAIPAGVFNAWGMIVSDVRHDLIRTNIVKLRHDEETSLILTDTFRELQDQILRIYQSEGIATEDVSIIRYADLRYYGQEYALKVSVPSGAFGVAEIQEMEKRFIETHNREYGFVLPGNVVELVNFHTLGVSKVKKPHLAKAREVGGSEDDALLGRRDVYVGRIEGWQSTPVYQREKLPVPAEIYGPAIIEENTATVIVPRDFIASTDEYNNIILARKDLSS
ncbi:MAG: hydantoinase/oxoprolinase family protein [Candidatus Geothermarchaeales archaeon]